MELTSATLKALNTSIKTIFNNAFNGTPSQFEKIAMIVPSIKESNTYAWLGMLAGLREWIGDRVIQNLKTHDYVIKNKKFEGTVGIPVEKIEDDDIGIYTPIVQSLAHNAKVHTDTLVFGLLKSGTRLKCYDGQPFFDTDHPVVDEKGVEVSVSNYQSGDKPGWYLLDTSRPIKPLIYQKRKDYKIVTKDDERDDDFFKRAEVIYGVDGRGNVGYGLWSLAYGSNAELTQANFEKAYAEMCSFKGDNGKALGIRPTILVVPPTLRSKANAIITVDRLSNGQSNPNKDLVEVMDTAWLA